MVKNFIKIIKGTTSYENSTYKNKRGKRSDSCYYKLEVDVAEKKSEFKFLGLVSKKNKFVVGEKFKIKIKVTNKSGRKFPGGELAVLFRWSTDQCVIKVETIKELENEEIQYIWINKVAPMSRDYGLIYVKATTKDKCKVKLTLPDGRLVSDGKKALISIDQVFALTREEIYTYLGSVLTAISITILLINNTISQWLNICWSTILTWILFTIFTAIAIYKI